MADLYDSQHEAGCKVSSVSPFLAFLKSCHGFTLIEVAVVLAVIGLVLALVMPRLPSTEAESLKISARTLAATLRYLQERSAAGQTSYLLRVEPGTNTLKILEAAADGGEKEPGDPLLQKRPLKEGIIVADVTIPRLGKLTDGEVRLEAGVGGLRDFTIFHLRSASGSFWTVMSIPSGGKVKVFEGYLEEVP